MLKIEAQRQQRQQARLFDLLLHSIVENLMLFRAGWKNAVEGEAVSFRPLAQLGRFHMHCPQTVIE